MNVMEAILLGIVQGLTEFLPVSSSGHLVVLMHLFDDMQDPEANLAFIVFAHMGTLCSVLLVFRKELLDCLSSNRIVILYLIAATIPVAVVGLAFRQQIKTMADSLLVVGSAFFVTAFLLVLAHFQKGEQKDLGAIGIGRAMTIGAFQAIAPVPGISRSGSTIAGGLFCGLDRTRAVSFAFLMSLPAIGGAMIMVLKDMGSDLSSLGDDILAAAFLASLLSGIAGIWIVKKVVSTNKLYLFSIYLVLAGAFTLGLHFKLLT